MGTWKFNCFAVLLALLLSVHAHGAGSLSGTVFHSNGSAIADAPVRAVDPATGTDVRTRSLADGRYSFADLPAGNYVLSVNMPCCEFIPFESEPVSVTPTGSSEFDIHMAPGNIFVEGDDPAAINAEILDRQVVPDQPAPRLSSGKPDLSGVWLVSQDPYPEKPKAKPWAEKLATERAESWFVGDPMLRCLPGSPPIPGASSFMTKFVHKPQLLVMLLEDTPGFRQIFLDGRRVPENLEPTWTGYSVGRWERDTLVVETTGYNDRGWTAGAYPRTRQFRMEERYSRPDFGHLKLQVTFEDPDVFDEPWVQNMTWDLAPQEELMEYVCENNKWAEESAAHQ